jgi:hypothetical protein
MQDYLIYGLLTLVYIYGGICILITSILNLKINEYCHRNNKYRYANYDKPKYDWLVIFKFCKEICYCIYYDNNYGNNTKSAQSYNKLAVSFIHILHLNILSRIIKRLKRLCQPK